MFIVKVENKFFNNSNFPKFNIVDEIKDATTFGSVYTANTFVEELRKMDYKNVYAEVIIK